MGSGVSARQATQSAGIASRIVPRLHWVAGFLILACLPLIVTAPYFLSLGVTLAITLILTLSYNLVIGLSGQFSLTHATFFGLGAYIAALLALQLGLSPWIGLLAGVVATATIAVAVGVPLLRLRGYYFAVATLAFGLLAEILVQQSTDVTGGAYGLQNIPPLTLFGRSLQGAPFYLLTLVCLFAVALALSNLMQASLGRSIIAVRDNEAAAAACGIDVARTKLAAFAIGAAVAALAGWLQCFFRLNLNPQVFSIELTFFWIFMVFIGGLGNVRGVVIATVVLTLAPELLGGATSQVVLSVGILMIVVALFAPRGVGGLIDDVITRLRKPSAR
jgi:branched-chain amino acid transport system permease protein